MKKRLISFLLAVSMMLSILPVGAFAAAVQNLEISAATHRPTSSGGSSSGWGIDGLDTDTATFVMGNQNVTITFKTNTPVETEYEITHQHGDLPDFSVTVDGAEVTTAKANTTVTLSLDTAQLPENATFAGWSVTAGNDTVNVTNGTSANNASFTMPGKAVTVSYTVTTISDTGDTAISSGDDAGAGVAIVLGGAAHRYQRGGHRQPEGCPLVCGTGPDAGRWHKL